MYAEGTVGHKWFCLLHSLSQGWTDLRIQARLQRHFGIHGGGIFSLDRLGKQLFCRNITYILWTTLKFAFQILFLDHTVRRIWIQPNIHSNMVLNNKL